MSSEQANHSVVRRIHIVGGSGSGKTTLARRLAAQLDVSAYDLDEIAYEGGAGQKRPLELRLANARCIAAEPGWITEGIYLWWTEELLQRADQVIWLDLPWRVAAWRIVSRHVHASLARNNRHPGVRKLMRFLGATRSYYQPGGRPAPRALDDDAASSRDATAEFLQPYEGKVIRCRYSGEVARLTLSTEDTRGTLGKRV